MKFDTSNLTIVPSTKDWEGVPRRFMPYCYLHGKLQDRVGYDTFGFQVYQTDLIDNGGSIQVGEIEPGIYPCVIDDTTFTLKDCLFYCWIRPIYGRYGGLVVYADDVEANSYARRMYDEKSMTL